MAVRADLWIDGAWTDVTGDSFVEGEGQVTVRRGRDADTGETDISECVVTLDNADGKYSPRLPTSPYYGKIGRNTPLRVSNGDPEPVTDTFTRSETDTWGTADSGQVWQESGGVAADRSVNGSVGIITNATTSGTQQYTTDTLTGVDAVVSITPQQVATGASMVPQILLRRASSSDYYAVRLILKTDGTVDVDVLNAADAVSSDDVATGLTYTTGTKLWLRARILDQTVRVRAWTDGSTEPVTWQLDYTVPSDTIASGSVGVAAQVFTGNTNTSPAFHYDDLIVTDLTKVRFVGEVPNWESKWTRNGEHVWVPIQASGIRRRLGQGHAPLRSAIYREIMSPSRPTPLAYWPLEDGSDSTQGASAIGGFPIEVETGSPSFEASDVFACSAALPTVGDAWLRGYVQSYTPNGTTITRVLAYVPEPATANQEMFSLRCSGTANLWIVRYLGSGGDLQVEAYAADDTALFTSSANHNIDGVPCSLELKLVENGANIDWTLLTTRIIDGIIFSAQISGTLNNRTVGRVIRTSLNYNKGLSDTVMGHLTITNDTALFEDTDDTLIGWTGETAGRRAERICEEEEIPFTYIGDLDDTARMGPQRPGERLELLQGCADSDGGILYETRYELGFTLRTRASMYNQAAAVALDYNEEHLQEPFEPVEDDQDTRNDITVERDGGSSARATRTTGSLSTLAPPDGVGTYAEQVTLSLFEDAQCEDQAGWRLHLGTWDEARYKAATIDLHDNTDIKDAVATLDSGDRITIDNLPAWMPPGQVELLVQGYGEEFDGIANWTATYNLTPAAPWNVGVLDDTVLGRLDTDGSELAASLGGEGTGTISVTAKTGGGSSTDGMTFNTASISPAANALLAMWIGHTAVGATTAAVSGFDATWKLQARVRISASTTLECWTAEMGASPGSGTVTITTAKTATSIVWNVNQVTGHAVGAGVRVANVKTNTGNGTATSLTFDAAQYANNRFVVGFGASANVTQTPRTSWTELGDNSITGPSVSVETQWRSDTAETTASSTLSGSSAWAAIGLEIVAGGETSFTVAVTDGPLWTTDAGQVPFDIKCGGEVMTVSAISGASSPQTFTVTRHVNRVVKAHDAGAAVSLDQPLILAL